MEASKAIRSPPPGTRRAPSAPMRRHTHEVSDRSRRVVMVTGASAGVGRAAAIAFGREGAAVGLIARGRAGLEGATDDVERAGGLALPLQVDVADHDAVEAAAARL